MRHIRGFVSGLLATGVALIAADAQGAPTLRVQVSQQGDFALIGNTLGHECAPGTPAPLVGTVGLCGLNINDSGLDVYWQADAPLPGQAEANVLIPMASARSAAVLKLPPMGQVTHAFLYWGAALAAPGTDTKVTLDREGGFTMPVDSSKCYQSTNNSYQCLADVTAIVQKEGDGAYRVGGVNIGPAVNVTNEALFAGWWMAVFYSDPNGTLRNLALFDGLDPVANGAPQNTMLTGFLIPNNGFTAKLGVVAFEGDNTIKGDQFLFNGNGALADAQNPVDNFFNGTRSTLGLATTVVGDLPQLSGGPQSMSGIDLDIVDVTAKVMGGQTSATVQGTSTGDVYYLAGFVTSISDYRPNFSTSTKTVTDVNGGVPIPGDVLEYEVVAINTGNDTAVNVVLSDAIPAGVTYVPGSLSITAGPNMGAKTDAAADDQGDFAGNTVTFRLGMGADGAQGGTIPIDGSSTVKFQVTIDQDAQGLIANQATINAAGENGAPPTDTPTDGNGGGDGAPPTDVLIEECGDDSMCPAMTPICDTAADPNRCVECIVDADCTNGLLPSCQTESGICQCVPSGAEVCDGFDNDCNGELDEGFGVGEPCSAGVGECMVAGSFACDSPDSAACDAVAGAPTDEICDSLDNNCDGTADEGLGVGDPCVSGLGQCAADGVLDCGPDGEVCSAVPGEPSDEVCEDALDSDCDGNNDNGCKCTADSDCGASNSGQVCEPDVCIAGCRGTGGNSCPTGQECTSSDETVGQCVPEGSSASDSAPTEGSASASATATDSDSASATDSATESDSGGTNGLDDEGFGCECNGAGSGAPMGLALLGLLALGRRRRRGV